MDTPADSTNIQEEIDRLECLIKNLDRKPIPAPASPSRRSTWLKDARKVCRLIAIAGIVALLWPGED